jgi:hypothetical protein
MRHGEEGEKIEVMIGPAIMTLSGRVQATSEVHALPRHQINSHTARHEGAYAIVLGETWGPEGCQDAGDELYLLDGSCQPTLSEEGLMQDAVCDVLPYSSAEGRLNMQVKPSLEIGACSDEYGDSDKLCRKGRS